MADAASTPSANFTTNGDRNGLVRWGTTTVTGLATGAKANVLYYSGAWTLQVDGTYGGATWTLQGSNDGTTWFTLNDTTATPVPATFSVGNKLLAIKERPIYVRFITTGGTGTALQALLAVSNF